MDEIVYLILGASVTLGAISLMVVNSAINRSARSRH